MAGGPRGSPKGNVGACRLQNLVPFDSTLGQVLDGENTHPSPSNKVLRKYNKRYHRTYLVEGRAMSNRYSQSSETIPKPHVVGGVWFPAVAVAFQ